MTTREPARSLGVMVAYGFPRGHLDADLAIASKIGAAVVEVLPDWRAFPDPGELKARVRDAGLRLHSAHGCWGGQSIEAPRVDLGHPDRDVRAASLIDLKRCVDWLALAGGMCLVVHPGGLSDPDQTAVRLEALGDGLVGLCRHARGTGITLCVENMPPGVHPGSEMADLASLLVALDREELALALDTGHANMTSSAEEATRSAGHYLKTTHVHDNNGRQDTHLPPGQGTIDWPAWIAALDEIGYEGPIMLECIRYLREHPESLDEAFLTRLRLLTGSSRPGD